MGDTILNYCSVCDNQIDYLPGTDCVCDDCREDYLKGKKECAYMDMDLGLLKGEISKRLGRSYFVKRSFDNSVSTLNSKECLAIYQEAVEAMKHLEVIEI